MPGVVAAVCKERTWTGVRPFDPLRDAGAVTELIAVAFQDKLGPDGEVMLAEMRRIARLRSLLGWYYWPSGGRRSLPPGFVWAEGGQVLGNVSIRRSADLGAFFIGNVAVHPYRRREGIASALMEAVVGEVAARGGRWIGLEVRADNAAARALYERLGFREVGRTLHMLRPAGLQWDGAVRDFPGLRPGRREDHVALVRLVKATVDVLQRPLLELRYSDYKLGWERKLNMWFAGRREVWWVVEVHGAICGAVRALQERGRRLNQLEVLVDPSYRGMFESLLVWRGVSSLHGKTIKMVETVLPSPDASLLEALEAHGFEKLRVLIQMRLDLSRRIPVYARGEGVD
jgi:ribosomal protein S18 acetylase RimI-like enzyme